MADSNKTYFGSPSEIRRRMMMTAKTGGGGGATTDNYIQDGLIFMLDGLNKGTNDGNWVDLVGGMLFTNYGAIENDKGFIFNGEQYMLGQSGVVYDITTYTIEVCIKPFEKSNWVLCTPSVNGYFEGFSVCFSDKGPYMHYSKENREGYELPSTEIDALSISMNTSLGYGNLIELTSKGKNSFSDRNVWVLGGRTGYPTPTTPRSLFNGEIYAVRIYNRTLNAEEMLNNQLVDNERFELGL